MSVNHLGDRQYYIHIQSNLYRRNSNNILTQVSLNRGNGVLTLNLQPLQELPEAPQQAAGVEATAAVEAQQLCQ